ncbi:hypothetical protein ABT324_02405 [Saccharopolyspora sp. NPDC000359]|uniref:hypothetical protein n=1 Tax=Saccharopolyspora sp. NPDC000359 TaxID=3154251 RepID=UPI00331FF4B7
MIRKVLVGAAVVVGTLAFSAPAMASDGVFAGVYPSEGAARQACSDGVTQGRWDICTFKFRRDGQVELWIKKFEKPTPGGTAQNPNLPS